MTLARRADRTLGVSPAGADLPSAGRQRGRSEEERMTAAHTATLLANESVHWGGFKWSGNFTTVDLVAASTNALNGALLARRPDHFKQYTIVGIMLMALL